MSYRHLLKNPLHFLSLGFGSGLFPKAPGTMGTVAAIPVVWLASYLGTTGFIIATVVAFLVGIYLCGYTAKAMGEHDHPSIVWDEIAGYMVAMIAVPVSVSTLLLAFILFRIFDILKPWPIRYLDRHMHGGLGIMVDDILAGLASLAIIHAVLAMGWL
ncbi:phosphatidylglycerophosphatase A [Aliidiomarina sedimenti]|uniref:Phosphatidylglycerophosphatase A n=2 Tax=Aliidiomarina TaxID=1249554 RepID=A0A432WEH0_9GAMM|nr:MULTISPECIES: phosphatidylglycerophosphatase A [Aliidiomarina]RUO28071.1 phosphatidylglycerophosphatase A [Aliidiomarina sedimenti]RUO31208.1 phosphatidylglycerophosphatase A [Aliidiomarina soli]